MSSKWLAPITMAIVTVAAVLGGGSNGRAFSPIYVNQFAAPGGNGTTWALAFDTLQEGLAAANSGDEVWVAQGIYTPGSVRTASFAMETGVAVYGGFLGNEVTLTERNPDVHVTVLSGNIDEGGDPAFDSYHVVTAGGTGASAVLDGVVVSGGRASGVGMNGIGGGILVTADGAPTIRDVTILDNSALDGGGMLATGAPTLTDVRFVSNVATGTGFSGFGGGLFLSAASSPAFTDLVFIGNRASIGGGMAIQTSGSGTVLDGATFHGNQASQAGAGINMTGGALALTDAHFSANVAGSTAGAIHLNSAIGPVSIDRASFVNNVALQGDGGAIVDSGTPLTVDNAEFTGNKAGSQGGGLLSVGATISVRNATFTGNAAGTAGGGLAFAGAANGTLTNLTVIDNAAGQSAAQLRNQVGNITLRNSIVWGPGGSVFEDAAGDDMTILDSIVQGGCPAETICDPADALNQDPLLGSLSDNGGFGRSRVPQAGSPAIDAATDCFGLTTDQRGQARPANGDGAGGAACDFGAVEVQPGAGTPTLAFQSASGSGAESSTPINIPVKLSTAQGSTVTVNYAVTGGTASSPSDYVLTAGTLVFPAATTTKNIVLTVLNDAADESNETVVVTLSAPSGATLSAPTVHTYTINDNDSAPVTLKCRGRLATIVGSDNKETLTGTKGPDVIVALNGNDTINGNGGDDVICAGGGNDVVNAGGGNDLVLGQGGNDTLKGDGGSDLLIGAAGKDKLAGGPSPLDGCNGGPGADSLLPSHGCESTVSIP